MIPNFKNIIPAIGAISVVILIVIVYVYYSNQLKASYKKGFDDANKKSQIEQQINQIKEQKVIIKYKNEVIKTKIFQNKLNNKPIIDNAWRLRAADLWYSKRENSHS